MARQVADLVQREMVKPSNQAWSCPVVLVCKDCCWWLCVDYRRFNSVTRMNACPLSSINDSSNALSSSWFLAHCIWSASIGRYPWTRSSLNDKLLWREANDGHKKFYHLILLRLRHVWETYGEDVERCLIADAAALLGWRHHLLKRFWQHAFWACLAARRPSFTGKQQKPLFSN